MTEFDIPWLQPETVPVTTEFDESPFQNGEFATNGEADHVPVGESAVSAEELVATCGQPPARPLPLLLRGSATATSRNPAVGYAQGLLNVFLASLQTKSQQCTDTSAATQNYIQSLLAYLVSLKQFPLVVDCVFGPGTEAATKMFQACRRLIRDGRIGPRTWPELEALARAAPGPPPPPPPPATSRIRVREDVWRLSATDPWHPTLDWYAQGVKALQDPSRNRPPSFPEPRSWRHLAEAHGTVIDPRQWPPGAKWDECEHGSWHFLPWHRIYLIHFERIVRDEIVRLGGPENWALPYWDYSDGISRPQVTTLPPAFRDPLMKDRKTPNPLRVEQRGTRINDGAPLSQWTVDIAQAFRETTFAGSRMTAGFGGQRAPAKTHRLQPVAGRLESLPHNMVHREVGGATITPPGLMALPSTAAQDPIFWLHHANIDRLWEAWLRARPTNINPKDDADWMSVSFSFGAGDAITTFSTSDVLDPRRIPGLRGLPYRYSDMPETPTPEAMAERPDEIPPHIGEDETRPPELVGASSGPVPIGSQPTTARVDITAATGPLARATSEIQTPPAEARVYLRLENITATVVGTSGIRVYVNIPSGARPDDFPDRHAGTFGTFGLEAASRRDANHSGSGFDQTFEITHIVRALSAAGSWDPNKLQVAFIPVPDANGQLGRGDMQVGRVSLFYT
jgi:tyrosinase